MSLTDRDRKLMLALIPVLVLVVYWFLVLAPKRSDATAAKDELTTQQARLDTARDNLQTAQGAKENFDASYAQVVKLGKAIPSTVDMPSLLVQLDAAAAGTGIRFTKIKAGPRTAAAVATTTTATPAPAAGSESGTTGTPVAAGGATAQSQPGGAVEAANNAQATSNQSTAAAENSGVNPSDTQTSTTAGATDTGTGATSSAAPAGLETVPLELEFQGNFFNLADFFHRVKRFVSLTNDNVVVSGRLVTVEGIRWSSDEAIFPKIRAEITATVYLSPKSQGVTAGATPTGPSTTPPAGTTPTDGATPTSAPTATATP
jgi:Type II secretion system (T2SS), protein M